MTAGVNWEIRVKAMATKHKTSGKPTPSAIMESATSSDAKSRLDRIAAAAFYKAEARGFVPGRELEDWLEAEAEFEGREGQ